MHEYRWQIEYQRVNGRYCRPVLHHSSHSVVWGQNMKWVRRRVHVCTCMPHPAFEWGVWCIVQEVYFWYMVMHCAGSVLLVHGKDRQLTRNPRSFAPSCFGAINDLLTTIKHYASSRRWSRKFAWKVADGVATHSKQYWCKRGGWLIMVDISHNYTMMHKRTGEGGWLATPSTSPGSAPV